MRNQTSLISRITALVLLFFTGINALIAGLLFMLDPGGAKMGMSLSYLANTPFKSYFIPGIVLFAANGILNIIVAILTLKRTPYYPALIILQGLILSGWIFIQVILVDDFNALHFTMLTIGLLLIIAGFILKK